MSWKKYFKVQNSSPLTNVNVNNINGSDNKYSHYASHLPEVYSGHPNRIERYGQYENMDIDSEVNAALDILAEFCTQLNSENNTPFQVIYHDDPSTTEIDIINKNLIEWCNLNDFNKRIFKMFRNTLKYGDQVFIRDPETNELLFVDMNDVSKVIVNESEGKKPEQYVIKNLNPNFENLTATQKTFKDGQVQPSQRGGYVQPSNMYDTNTGSGGRFEEKLNEKAVEAQYIVHLSLTEGLDANWPFGNSILENVFKVFKQKELLEDAIIIYRIQRAPERRVFYVDVGNMPNHMAMAFVDRVKNEIHQRRIPSQTGGGNNIMDTTYNPLSINEDYFFPQTAEGRGSKVETLPGGTNLGEIDDLKFFTNKLFRGLRIPSSYLPTGPEESPAGYADGRVGTAMIQEHRFNEYCKRLQRLISEVLDTEFKLFLKQRGLILDNRDFELKFTEPQNFSKYRETELDTGRISTFTQLEGFPYMSKRFLMQRYLGLTESEIKENEKMWNEENTDQNETDQISVRSVGITPGMLDRDSDDLTVEEPAAEETGVEGTEEVAAEAPVEEVPADVAPA